MREEFGLTPYGILAFSHSATFHSSLLIFYLQGMPCVTMSPSSSWVSLCFNIVYYCFEILILVWFFETESQNEDLVSLELKDSRVLKLKASALKPSYLEILSCFWTKDPIFSFFCDIPISMSGFS